MHTATLYTLTTGEFVSTHKVFMLDKVTMVRTVAVVTRAGGSRLSTSSRVPSGQSLKPGGIEVAL